MVTSMTTEWNAIIRWLHRYRLEHSCVLLQCVAKKRVLLQYKTDADTKVPASPRVETGADGCGQGCSDRTKASFPISDFFSDAGAVLRRAGALSTAAVSGCPFNRGAIFVISACSALCCTCSAAVACGAGFRVTCAAHVLLFLLASGVRNEGRLICATPGCLKTAPLNHT